LVQPALLDIQDLAAQWQDGLEAPVAALLGAVMHEDAAGEREVMGMWHLDVIDIETLLKLFNRDHPMVVVDDRLASAGFVAVEITPAERVEAQQRFIARLPSIRLVCL